MGTLSFPGLETSTVESSTGSLTIGQATFPFTDSTPRATAVFGDSLAFVSRSQRQEVTTSSAVISVGVSIVGVNFNGPVSLTFADSGVDINDLHIVDEGGFCSATNTITTLNDSGSLAISNPYSSMRLRISGGVSIPEAIAPVINEDGSQTTENPDGSTTEVDTTLVDDSGTTTTEQVLADGTTVDTVVQSDGSSATSTVLPDGTSIDTTESSVGNKTSFTAYPDGSTVAAEESNSGNMTSFTTLADGTTIEAEQQNNGNVSSFTSLPDGTTIDVVESNNGNTSQVTVSPEGNIDTVSSQSNGTINNSTVNVDGSSYSFERRTNGKIYITNVSVDGTEVVEEYIPWKSFYTVTTTPPGTSETFSPNPYAS